LIQALSGFDAGARDTIFIYSTLKPDDEKLKVAYVADEDIVTAGPFEKPVPADCFGLSIREYFY
jgi:hypothetical protein